MLCTISKLRRRQRVALTPTERKFDTSGGKSPYSEDPRNSCVGTQGLAAPFVMLRPLNLGQGRKTRLKPCARGAVRTLLRWAKDISCRESGGMWESWAPLPKDQGLKRYLMFEA